MLSPEPLELPFDVLNGLRARFNQQFVTTARAIGRRIMTNIERQKIEPLTQVTNMSLFV